MSRVRCQNCGKSYRYETNGCCPECGAYNRPPRRMEVHADGTVYGADRYAEPAKAEKVCYEEQTCHEEDARRVRFEGERLKAALKGFHPKMGKQGKKESGKIGSAVAVLVALLIAMLASKIDVSFHDIGQWDNVDYENITYAELDEYFMLDGQEMRVTDLQILDDTLRFSMVGGSAFPELWGYSQDGEYYEQYAQSEELLSGYPITCYTFSLENISQVEKLTLQSGEGMVELDLNMTQVQEGEYFDCQGEEVRVVAHDVQWSGPSKVLDNNILTVEIEGELNGALPELWMEDGEIPLTLPPESWDGNVLRYNLHRMEPSSMTLQIPCAYGKESSVWLVLDE